MSTATRRHAVPRLRLPRPSRPSRPRGRGRLPRPGRRTLAGIVVLAATLTGAWFWVRQSSLVAVQRVTVTGVSGPDAVAIRQTLVQTAERMTTMEIDSRRLKASVSRYPFVRSLRVSVSLPHTATISVFEQVPVGVLDGTTVSAHGTLLSGVSPSGRPVPTITASSAASGSGSGGASHPATVTGTARADVYLLASAPYPILARLATAGWRPGRGLTVTLRNGPIVYFGDDIRLAAKWRSVILTLAQPSSAGASYIDVTDPTRPAAGAGTDIRATSPPTSSSGLTGTTGQTTTVPGG